MDVKEIACKDVVWVHLIQNRAQGQTPVNRVINFWVP
jgi:hypothetical protein